MMTTVDAQESQPDGAVRSCRAVEQTLCDVWSGLFGRDVSPYDDFFDLGGDSFTIIDMVQAVRKRGIHLRSSEAMRHTTPARLAECLTVRADGPPPTPGVTALPALWAAVDRLFRTGTRSWADGRHRAILGPVGGAAHPGTGRPVSTPDAAAPLFVLHSDSHVRRERAAVATWLGARPAVGLLVPGADGSVPPAYRLAELAGRHLEVILAAQPAGPVYLAGFGQHAVVAFELARQFRRTGREVALVAMIEPPAIGTATGPPPDTAELIADRFTRLAGRFGLTGRETVDEILDRMRDDGWYDVDTTPADLSGAQLGWAELVRAVHGYDGGAYDGRVLLFQDGTDPGAADLAWTGLVADLRVYSFDYGLEPPSPLLADARLAAVLRTALADRPAPG